MSGTLRFYTSEKLGRTQSITPEGFLLCQDVAIARTGVQLYCDADGLPDHLVSDSQGLIRIHRDEGEVFRPITIASFNGKPVTNDHPPVKVDPRNWKDYSIGTVINPRRGNGSQFDNDFMYADLLITDAQAIKDVRDGKREISAGYDAEYEYLRPGEGRQHLIVGNHVALVDKGRCGPKCAIGDSAMAKTNTPVWMDRILEAFRTNDEGKLVSECDKIKEMLGEVFLGSPPNYSPGYAKVPSRSKDAAKDDDKEDKEDDDDKEDMKKTDDMAKMVKDAIRSQFATLDSRINNVERAVAIMATRDADESDKEDKDEEKKEDKEDDKEDKKSTDDADKDDDDEKDDKKDTEDRRASVGDSSSMKIAWQEVVSRAEFLAPGIKRPTFDAKASPKMTIDAMCKFRRKVLDEAMKEEDTRAAILQIADGKPKLTQMTCDSITLLFNGASNEMRKLNNQVYKPSNGVNYNFAGTGSATDTVRAINASNKSFWDRAAKQ